MAQSKWEEWEAWVLEGCRVNWVELASELRDSPELRRVLLALCSKGVEQGFDKLRNAREMVEVARNQGRVQVCQEIATGILELYEAGAAFAQAENDVEVTNDE